MKFIYRSLLGIALSGMNYALADSYVRFNVSFMVLENQSQVLKSKEILKGFSQKDRFLSSISIAELDLPKNQKFLRFDFVQPQELSPFLGINIVNQYYYQKHQVDIQLYYPYPDYSPYNFRTVTPEILKLWLENEDSEFRKTAIEEVSQNNRYELAGILIQQLAAESLENDLILKSLVNLQLSDRNGSFDIRGLLNEAQKTSDSQLESKIFIIRTIFNPYVDLDNIEATQKLLNELPIKEFFLSIVDLIEIQDPGLARALKATFQ